GRVLPIGGLKEKLLAAHRGGVKVVLVPSENEKDLKDIPAEIRKDIELRIVENMDDVLRLALVGGERLLGVQTVPGVEIPQHATFADQTGDLI
ncbi:MAG: endopeptidase La, partial [Deltaproteobacteria bacterium]|nr:endopeptidase La [Deltaproteobacteria bacterium]